MVETLILGFCLGALVSAGVAAYLTYKHATRPAFIQATTDGCIVALFDKSFENDPYNIIGIKNGNGDVVAAIKFDKYGIVDTAITLDAKK